MTISKQKPLTPEEEAWLTDYLRDSPPDAEHSDAIKELMARMKIKKPE